VKDAIGTKVAMKTTVRTFDDGPHPKSAGCIAADIEQTDRTLRAVTKIRGIE
jgi:hypothetical protein